MNIYFSGIGGVGIGALASIAHSAGNGVFGSDQNSSLMIEELSKKDIEIEKTDAVKFSYSDESWYTLRPSGTEPKVKLYVYVKDADKKVAEEKLVKFEEKVLELLYSID